MENEEYPSVEEDSGEQKKPAPVPEAVEQWCDVLEIEAGGLINTKDIASIDMPKLNVVTVNGFPYIEKSNILITMNDNPNVCSNMIIAVKKGLQKEITITTYLDEEKTEVADVWKIKDAEIKGINFGQMITLAQQEQRVVQCEIGFSKLNVNGEEI